MIYNTKRIKLLIICLILPLLSGCWNNRDLTELGIVVGMGLEKVENNEIEITIQLIEPTLSEGEKQGGKNKTWRSLSARGYNVFEANRNLLTKVNKRVSYSNVQLMIIGEKLAQNGIDDVLDFFQRVHEIDKRELILITKGIKPKELLGLEADQAPVSSLEIIETIKNTNRLASIREMTMYDLILNIAGENNSVIGMVEFSKESETRKISDLNFQGAAVFKKDKLVGWLTPMESYGFSIVDNKFKNPSINVPNPVNPDKKVTIEIDNSVAKKNIVFNNDKPVITVEVYVHGRMVEQHGKGDLTSAEQIRALEAETAKQIKKTVDITIKNAQQNLQTDIFGFGKIAHGKNLTYWRKVENNWDDVFSHLPVDIKVEYRNRNMGFIKKHM